MYAAIILAALMAAGATPAPVAPAAHATAGLWRLSQIGGKVGCTLTLSDDPGAGGHALKFPAACDRAFPPLKDLSQWGLDAQGALTFSGAPGIVAVVFSGPPGGPYEAKAPDGKAWRLEPARK